MNKEHFKLAQDHLEKLAGKKPKNDTGTGGDNAWFGYVNTAGKFVTEHHWPCQRQMSSWKDPSVVYSKYMIHPTAFAKPWENIPKDFLKWLVGGTSPWYKMLETNHLVGRDALVDFDYLYNHGFVFSELMETPANVLMNFLVAARMLKEWPDALKTWHILHKHGVDRSLAFLWVATFMDSEQYDFPSEKSGHLLLPNTDKYDWPLDMATCENAYVGNFLQDKWVYVNPPYGENTSYYPVNCLWGRNGNSEGHKSKAWEPFKSLAPYSEETYGYNLYLLYSGKFGKKPKTETKSSLGAKMSPVGQWKITFEDYIAIALLEQERLMDHVAA